MAVTSVHQRELVKKQQLVIRADEISSNIDAIFSEKSQGTKAKQLLNGSTKQPHKSNVVKSPDLH